MSSASLWKRQRTGDPDGAGRGGKNVPHASSLYRQAGVIFQKKYAGACQALPEPRYPGDFLHAVIQSQGPGALCIQPFPRRILATSSAFKRNTAVHWNRRLQAGSIQLWSLLMPPSVSIQVMPKPIIVWPDAPEASGRLEQAGREYILARDYDELRFRCDSEFNNLIRAMAGEKGCLVADIEGLFKSVSPDSLTGLNLFSEHLHPTAYGHPSSPANMPASCSKTACRSCTGMETSERGNRQPCSGRIVRLRRWTNSPQRAR